MKRKETLRLELTAEECGAADYWMGIAEDVLSESIDKGEYKGRDLVLAKKDCALVRGVLVKLGLIHANWTAALIARDAKKAASSKRISGKKKRRVKA